MRVFLFIREAFSKPLVYYIDIVQLTCHFYLVISSKPTILDSLP